MDSISSASYAPLSGSLSTGASSSVNIIERGITRVQSVCSRRFKVTYFVVTSFVLLVFTAAALGGPWITVKTSSGGTTTTNNYSLSKQKQESCTSASCTEYDAVWLGGLTKAAGDPVSALLALVLVDSFAVLFSAVSLSVSICKVADAPFGLKVLRAFRNKVVFALLLTTVSVITFPAVVLPSTPSTAPGSTTTNTVTYGGGFVVALINVLFMAFAWYLVEGLIEEESELTNAANNTKQIGGVALPPATAPHNADYGKTGSFSGIYPDPSLSVGSPGFQAAAYDGSYQQQA